jgi:hypothetical protein
VGSVILLLLTTAIRLPSVLNAIDPHDFTGVIYLIQNAIVSRAHTVAIAFPPVEFAHTPWPRIACEHLQLEINPCENLPWEGLQLALRPTLYQDAISHNLPAF